MEEEEFDFEKELKRLAYRLVRTYVGKSEGKNGEKIAKQILDSVANTFAEFAFIGGENSNAHAMWTLLEKKVLEISKEF
jgi:hypothetical protein